MNNVESWEYLSRIGHSVKLIPNSTFGGKNELGGYHEKLIASGCIESGGGTREVSFFVKDGLVYNEYLFGDENIDMLGAERYFERWKYLKKVKIPTIESMRYVGFGKVVMGDMTASGSNFFGKSEILKLENEVKNGEHRHLSEAENRFLALDDKLVVLEIKKLLNLAWGKDVDLPYDNEEYTILLDKGGEFKVIVADLSCLWRRKFRTIEIYKLEEQKMIERFFKHRNLLFGVMG